MKKILIVLQLTILVLLLAGCKEKTVDKIETLDISSELFVYEGTKEAEAIAVDKNGLLYTATYKKTEKDSSDLEEDEQRICVYDLDGTCIKQVDVTMGNGTVQAMLIEEDTLYCVISHIKKGLVLFAVDINSWEVTEVAELDEYWLVSRLVHIGDYFYILGQSELAEDKTYTLHPSVHIFNYAGEVVGRVSAVDKETQVEFLSVDFPVDMYQTKEDTLVVYQYTEENGFGFLEFNPQEDTLEEVGFKESSTSLFGFSSCEDGYLFVKNDMLYYGTVEGMEAHIDMNPVFLGRDAIRYTKGFAFYLNQIGDKHIVERVGVADVLKENREIRLLMSGSGIQEPYGHGYQMKKQELNSEEFALKVLAQDTDFDMYLLHSTNSSSYHIKEKGVFYPLNEVEGVQEYIDACFPYLKEVATNEEGDIWMLPIDLFIFGLFYDKDYCASQGVDFSTMDFKEFLAFTEYASIEMPEKINRREMTSTFFGQYLSAYDTFDTEVFRECAKQMQSLSQNAGTFRTDFIMPIRSNGVLQGELPEFFYESFAGKDLMVDYNKKIEELGVADRVGMTAIPKLSEDIGNMARLTFLAVNPQSENLEATLEYIATLCKYMVNQQDTFLLADKSMYTNTPFIMDCYELYAGGEVYFAMNDDVYMNLFNEYLDGTLELEELVSEIERKREIYVKE